MHLIGLYEEHRIVLKYRDDWKQVMSQHYVPASRGTESNEQPPDDEKPREQRRCRTKLSDVASIYHYCLSGVSRAARTITTNLVIQAILMVLTCLGTFVHPFFHSLVVSFTELLMTLRPHKPKNK